MQPTDRDTVRVLNGILTIELAAINQYFIAYRLCEHWGYLRLAAHFKDASWEEMRDADNLTVRICRLGGLPNLQRLDPFQIGENVIEMIRLSESAEQRAVDALRAGIPDVEGRSDFATGQLLRELLAEEETHLEWARAQLALIEQLGEENWLTLQVAE